MKRYHWPSTLWGELEKGEGGLADPSIVALEGLLHEPVSVGAGLALGGRQGGGGDGILDKREDGDDQRRQG